MKFEGSSEEDAPPAPFNDWFPAVSASINLFTMNSHQLQFYMSSYSIPQNTAEFDIDVTYMDTQELTLKRWLTKWVNESILGDVSDTSRKGLLKPMSEVARHVRFQLHKYNKETAVEYNYWVTPEGASNLELESGGGPHQYQLSLHIVGSAPPP